MRESNQKPKVKGTFKNKLHLNKFHQISKAPGGRANLSNFQRIKKQVRDLKRLISHGKLSEEALAAKQQELTEKEKQLGITVGEKKVNDKKVAYFARKYDQIRSNEEELKKLARRIKQIKKCLEGEGLNEEEKNTLLREQADLVVKVNYVKKFPKDQKYISVFKENVEHATTKKNQMMEQIAERKEKFRAKKFAMVEEQPTKRKVKANKEDGFFTENQVEVPLVEKKKVNKMGLIVS